MVPYFNLYLPNISVPNIIKTPLEEAEEAEPEVVIQSPEDDLEDDIPLNQIPDLSYKKLSQKINTNNNLDQNFSQNNCNSSPIIIDRKCLFISNVLNFML